MNDDFLSPNNGSLVMIERPVSLNCKTCDLGSNFTSVACEITYVRNYRKLADTRQYKPHPLVGGITIFHLHSGAKNA